jgi:Uma2 family endonuclease
MSMTTRKYWTDEELLAMPDDGHEREIVSGELVMMSPAGADHGGVITNILGPLFVAVASAKLGKVLEGQTGCRMNSGDLFSPDISFVSLARWIADRETKTTFFTGSPDLVVEVLSPGDRLSVTQEKIRQYFENGARLAWIVNPRTRMVHVHRGPVVEKVLMSTDCLDGEEVVPGFRLALADVFS